MSNEGISRADLLELIEMVRAIQSDIRALRSESLSKSEAAVLEQRLRDFSSSSTPFLKLEADHSNLNTSATLRLGELERRVSEMARQIIALQSQSQRGQHPPS